MQDMNEYMHLIRTRGNSDGSGGGLLDLLTWCNKLGLREVSEEDMRRFWENPRQPYAEGQG